MIITENDKKILSAIAKLSVDGAFIGKMNEIGKLTHAYLDLSYMGYTNAVKTGLYRMEKNGFIELEKVKQNYYFKLTELGSETVMTLQRSK